ncbi:MAG TPA: SPFH domain-containing protein, partial [Saccharofermentans sp.]|nr:SPFH domain-containing protein [Saccharofermentans sp.]
MDGGTLAFIIILAIALFILFVSCVKIVPQATTFVIERFGAYKTTWETGIHFMIPIVNKVAKRISLKEKVADFAPQAVITKDNV